MRLIHQTHHGDNHLMVFEDNGSTLLKINTLTETHSIYKPGDSLVEPLVGHYWNFITMLPYLRETKKACVLGLGAGTITRQFAEYHPDMKVDGVEIDSGVIEVAREYFSLPQHNLTIHVRDGVAFITEHAGERDYGLILLDAFETGNLSARFLNPEFFDAACSRMTPGGLLVANYIHDLPIHHTIKELFITHFKEVWIIPVAESTNNIIIGTQTPLDLKNGKTKELPARFRPLADYTAATARKIHSSWD